MSSPSPQLITIDQLNATFAGKRVHITHPEFTHKKYDYTGVLIRFEICGIDIMALTEDGVRRAIQPQTLTDRYVVGPMGGAEPSPRRIELV